MRVGTGSRRENASKQKIRAFSGSLESLPVASWFETREDALLTMRV
jgi:hypothetical protein